MLLKAASVLAVIGTAYAIWALATSDDVFRTADIVFNSIVFFLVAFVLLVIHVLIRGAQAGRELRRENERS